MAKQVFDVFCQTSLKFINSASSLINYQPVRNRLWTNVRPIMGWPRKHLYNVGKKYPEKIVYNWRPYLPEDETYTIKPLPIYKMGGRDLETGRVVVRTLGGGNKKNFRWVDTSRSGNEDGSVKEERVLQLKYSPLHTPDLALVADAERMRWILAPDGVKVGDILKTFTEIPRNPVRAKQGDSHPLGALPNGTIVHHIETTPGKGAKFCLVAGSSGKIVKKLPTSVTVQMSNGDQFKFEPSCMAVVGKMSNVGHKDIWLWCPQRLRWLGKRPRSGQWRRKDGYCGRKIRPKRLIDVTLNTVIKKQEQLSRRNVFDLGS